jgi:hypothetical protein
MAVDQGYGSGKPLSAAQSRARRRVAKGQLSKSKKGNAALKKVAAENPVTGFIGGGILPSKLLKAASSLRVAGQASKAAAVESRYLARTGGAKMDRAEVDWIQNMGEWGSLMKAGRRTRLMSEKVFPKVTNYSEAGTFNRYGDLLPKATRKARGIKRVNPQAE